MVARSKQNRYSDSSMTLEEQLRWVRPPVQDRSQKTMERLLVAAEARIIEVGFEKATIAEIAKRADSSVGAFYARFSDKDALLRCLLDRFVFEAKATMDSAMRPELWQEVTVETLCTQLLTFLSKVLGERRLFIVALAKASMDDSSFGDFRGALSMHAAAGLGRLVEAQHVAIRGEDLSKAMRVVAWVCLSVLETNCVHGQPALGTTSSAVSNDQFLAELGAMIVAYLSFERSPSLLR